jgi:hypothetical protein
MIDDLFSRLGQLLTWYSRVFAEIAHDIAKLVLVAQFFEVGK